MTSTAINQWKMENGQRPNPMALGYHKGQFGIQLADARQSAGTAAPAGPVLVKLITASIERGDYCHLSGLTAACRRRSSERRGPLRRLTFMAVIRTAPKKG